MSRATARALAAHSPQRWRLLPGCPGAGKIRQAEEFHPGVLEDHLQFPDLPDCGWHHQGRGSHGVNTSVWIRVAPDPRNGQLQHLGQPRGRERAALSGQLHLHQLAPAGGDEIGVHMGLGVFGVIEVQEQSPAHEPDAHRRHLDVGEGIDRPPAPQALQGQAQGHEGPVMLAVRVPPSAW